MLATRGGGVGVEGPWEAAELEWELGGLAEGLLATVLKEARQEQQRPRGLRRGVQGGRSRQGVPEGAPNGVLGR